MSKAYMLKMRGVCYTLNTIERHCVVYAIENHPNDSRVKLDNRGIVQTLNQRMGTGGGNVPMVMQEIISIDRAAFNQGENAKYDFSISGGVHSNISCKGSECYMLSNGSDRIGALCATDYKWVQQEQVMQGKIIVQWQSVSATDK